MSISSFFDKLGYNKSIKQKLISYLLIIAVLPILLGGYLAFNSGRKSTEDQIISHLTSIADLKTSEIEIWITERVKDTKTLAEDHHMRDYLIALETELESEKQISEDDHKVQNKLQIMKHGYKRVFLVDSSGRIVASTDKEDIGRKLIEEYVWKPMTSQELYIEDIFRSSEDEILMAFSAPIFESHLEDNKKIYNVIGVIVLEMNMEETLYPIIGNWPGMGRTGETLLVRREANEVLFINELRHMSNTALSMRINVNSDIATPAIFASEGDDGILRAKDYRGVEVLSAYRYISLMEWGFVAKIDQSEAFAPITSLKKKIEMFTISLILLVIGFAFWISKGFTGPIISLQKSMEKISEGDFSVTSEVKRGDELGQLSTSFNIMTQKLKMSYTALEEEIRKHKQTEESLKYMVNELESFSYSVSHDLRAPLRAIAGFSNIVLEDYAQKLDAEGQRYLGIIDENSKFMGKLIDDILNFSRIGRQDIKSSNINMEKLVKSVYEELKTSLPDRKLKFKVKKLPPAQGDKAMIHQVFVNLIGNAIKFTKPKKNAVIEVGGNADGDQNVYYVKDNGVGFDMKYVDKLWGVFQRLHSAEEFGGTGVGLAIVQRIINRHGGKVWAEGKVNEGATLYFTLPKKLGG